MVAPNNNDEIVELALRLNAAQASKTLEATQKRIEVLSESIQNLAVSSGTSLRQAAEYIKQQVKEYNRLAPAGEKIRLSSAQYADALKLASIETKNTQKSALLLLRTQQQITKEAEKQAAAAARLAAAASKPAEVLGKTFTAKEFAPVLQQFQQLSKINFSNVTNYAQNIQSLMGGIRNISQLTGASIQDVGKHIQQNFQNVPKVALQDAMRNLNKETRGVGQSFKDASGQAKGFHQILNLIRGTLVAIGVFRVFNFIEESIRKAMETAIEFEQSLYRLSNVERILSQEGLEVSFSGLKDGIEEIKRLLPIFSRTDITQQVSLIGIMTKELGYTEKQILDLAKAIGVLNIRSPEPESLTATTQKILTALVAPTGRGISTLGIPLGEDAIEAEAFAESLLKAGESFKDLTKQEKDLIKLNIVLKNANEELINIDEYLQSNAARLDENTAAWEDFLNEAGKALLPFIPALTSFFETLQSITITAKQLFVLFGAGFVAISVSILKLTENFSLMKDAIIAIFTGGDVLAAISQMVQNAAKIPETFVFAYEQSFSELRDKFFPELREQAETATGDIKKFGDALSDITELEGFDKLAKDLEKLQRRIEDLNEEFSIDQAREWEDYQVDIQRIVEDFAIKRERIIEDSNDKIDNANKKFQNNQLDDEARFQEQMRQLREKFLFNLEDALRERDARQVLRLQRQYQMDKTALENEHALRKQDANRRHQEDIQRIKDERDKRLDELAQEERIRLQREREDYELKKQREEEDHARDIEDLKKRISERLAEFAEQLGEEYDLNADAVEQLRQLLEEYYGPNGFFDQMYDYSYDSMVAKAQGMLNQVNAIIAQAQRAFLPTFNPGAISAAPLTGANNIGPQAQGGTYLATRPTVATFGEAGPEIAQFIPVSKLRAGTGNGGMSGGGGMNGQIQIEMLLSPDLEARVVRNSLSGVAEVVAKVRRTKS